MQNMQLTNKVHKQSQVAQSILHSRPAYEEETPQRLDETGFGTYPVAGKTQQCQHFDSFFFSVSTVDIPLTNFSFIIAIKGGLTFAARNKAEETTKIPSAHHLRTRQTGIPFSLRAEAFKRLHRQILKLSSGCWQAVKAPCWSDKSSYQN